MIVQYIHETFEDAHLAGYTNPGWYFWDETESQCYGPYIDEDTARADQYEYFDWINRDVCSINK